jgi:hypothetical protein
MKKYILLLLLASVGLLTGCKKDKDNPEPNSGVEIPNGSILFLKSLSVTGSEKVTFDSTKKYFAVNLPESYTNEIAEVKLSLHDNVLLMDSLGNPTTGNVINYDFRGRDPLTFTLKDKDDKYAGYFTVFFSIAGGPKVEIANKDITINTSGFKSPFRFVSGVGTIPSKPEETPPVLKVINKQTGFAAETNIYPNQENINFDGLDKLVTADPIVLELHFKDQNPIIFEGIKFTRGEPVLNVTRDNKFVYSSKDSVFASGGYFSTAGKYSARFSSDFLKTAVSAPIKVNNATSLAIEKIPANLPEGSYLVSFYEGEKAIGRTALYVSNTGAKCIETIWKGEVMQALSRNVEHLSFKKGDTFYAKPSPLEYGSSNTVFNKNKLPTLRLKSGATSVDLKPELAVVNWATAGVSYPVGKYLVPKTLANGSYDVIAVFPDKQESKPYWSKLQVN